MSVNRVFQSRRAGLLSRVGILFLHTREERAAIVDLVKRFDEAARMQSLIVDMGTPNDDERQAIGLAGGITDSPEVSRRFAAHLRRLGDR